VARIDKCDLCGIDLPAGSYCPPVFDRNERKFRLDIQVFTGNGRWQKLWKSADFCKDCYFKMRTVPVVRLHELPTAESQGAESVQPTTGQAQNAAICKRCHR
jgi:hypothetical protein